jgi:hypothetical protein
MRSRTPAPRVGRGAGRVLLPPRRFAPLPWISMEERHRPSRSLIHAGQHPTFEENRFHTEIFVPRPELR